MAPARPLLNIATEIIPKEQLDMLNKQDKSNSPSIKLIGSVMVFQLAWTHSNDGHFETHSLSNSSLFFMPFENDKVPSACLKTSIAKDILPNLFKAKRHTTQDNTYTLCAIFQWRVAYMCLEIAAQHNKVKVNWVCMHFILLNPLFFHWKKYHWLYANIKKIQSWSTFFLEPSQIIYGTKETSVFEQKGPTIYEAYQF